MTAAFRFALLLASIAVATGCSGTREVNITSEPQAAFIQIDGQNAGNAPLTHTFNFRHKPSYVVTASLQGYFTEEVVLGGKSPPVQYGALRIVLLEDEAFKATTTSEATNAWLRIQISPTLTADMVWQKLVDSVTSAYSSLEQLDNSSGYIRSVSTSRKFRGPKGQFSVRTRFTGSIAQKEPLLYKLKIESEISWNGSDWSPYSRVYKEDAALIEELQSRLGIK
ncbi:MAG: hypothetical protein HUU15_01280 [Candidatus Brocadiae bacterium]|nr:hypothetical protein [Candidatus Brocadiia bacterium]